MAKLLVTQPNYDYTTRYLSQWANKAVALAKEKGLSAVCLKNKRANKREFESVIKKTKPSFLFLNGHGSERCVTGQDDEVLVEVGVNEGILGKMVVYALSCRSARVLGKQSLKSGAVAYLGYNEDFIFFYDEKVRTNPKIDKTAGLFLDPPVVLATSLIKGHPTRRAYVNSQNAYRNTIIKLLSSEATFEYRTYIRYLVWDMSNQVCLGNQAASI